MRNSRDRRLGTLWMRGAALALLVVTGCQGDRVQSALHPTGPAAESVARLWWVLLVVLGVYSLGVFVLTLLALFRRPPVDAPAKHGGRIFILTGGVILPSLILVPLLVYSMSATSDLRMRSSDVTIRVIGKRWWWQVEYPDHGIITANELAIPVGEPVRLELTSDDVIHSFWVPQLHGKMDTMPGQTTTFWIQADRPGTYRGQCAEYCGLQHANMAMLVHALPREEYDAWVRARAEAPADVASDAAQVQRGRAVYFRTGCAACHAIEGTPSEGRAGPDLTNLGARETLASAIIPNTPENLLRWLADPQSIKPGVNMPATHVPVEDLEALVAYLISLDGPGGER